MPAIICRGKGIHDYCMPPLLTKPFISRNTELANKGLSLWVITECEVVYGVRSKVYEASEARLIYRGYAFRNCEGGWGYAFRKEGIDNAFRKNRLYLTNEESKGMGFGGRGERVIPWGSRTKFAHYGARAKGGLVAVGYPMGKPKALVRRRKPIGIRPPERI